jgi:hypothetical protein
MTQAKVGPILASPLTGFSIRPPTIKSYKVERPLIIWKKIDVFYQITGFTYDIIHAPKKMENNKILTKALRFHHFQRVFQRLEDGNKASKDYFACQFGSCIALLKKRRA